MLVGSDADYGYLQRPYLADFYLNQVAPAALPMQISLNPSVAKATRASIVRSVGGRTKSTGVSVFRQVNDDKAIGAQILFVRSKSLKMQVRRTLYNTYNLRVLWDMASRGTTGSNWTVRSGTVVSGDFGVNNLNTDIVEEQFRMASKIGPEIQCDTQVASGVYVDTIAILSHNLSVSGSITVTASNELGFSNPEILELKPDGTENLIYISPTLPQSAYRYWRFTFNDTAGGQLKVGAIIFGSASILEGENVVATITKTPKHFADKVQTEGFTAVSNDRALKNAVSLEFRNLDYSKTNYSLLKTLFAYCRTSLKALWIPTPRMPTRFAVFGKLPSIPSEQHNAISDDADYVSFSVEVDESL